MAAAACNNKPMSILIEDNTKGMNGDFEHTRDGMPVNWQLYTAQTVPAGDFDILADSSDYKEGKRSLKLVVRECDTTGGWHSPGMAKQIKAKPGEVYHISFWVKNQGTTFRVNIAGVSATKGQAETIVQTGETIDDWKQYRYTYTIPEKMNALRFEMNVLQPGSFWIDDIRIERN